jgi:Raf kinase inhibitor-like YbhB/YbcL family protein
MKISSPAFDHGGKIPSRHTCDGENVSPPLLFSDVPGAAKTLTLIMDDPDVPKHVRKEGIWDHWIVFNIPADLRDIKEGEEPPGGTPGLGTNGNEEYFGPCPPDREHRYFFKLYALDTELNLPQGASKKQVEDAMKGHVLEQAELMGRYERQ